MIKILISLLFLIVAQSQNTIEFTKFGQFRWDISLDHMIVKIKPDFNEFQLNTMMKDVHGKVVRKLNNNDYYLVQFRNNSKTEIIFQKQLEKIKKVAFINDLIPVMKFTDKLSNLDVYENSDVSGFSIFKNDSLFTENIKLRENFISCYNREFRNQPKFVRYIYVNFQIVNGETKDLNILETDMEEEYLECIKRVIFNQNWKNNKFKGRTSFFYIVYSD